MGGSSSSSANQRTENRAWDNRAAGTDNAIVASGRATITTSDQGTVAAAHDIATKALEGNSSGFMTYAERLSALVDKAVGVTEKAQTSAQEFAIEARMDAETSQMTKLLPWVAVMAVALMFATMKR
ncbi:MAG: hypothetical protein RLO08_00305 [Parvibaculaceae bacterium]